MTEANEDGDKPEKAAGFGEVNSFEPAQGAFRKVEISWMRQRRKVPRPNRKCIDTPSQQDDHHDGDKLHDVECFFAGFRNALCVFPPEVNCDDDGETSGDQTCGAFGEVRLGKMKIQEQLVEKATEILAGRDAADGAREDIVKHQSGNGKFCETAAERLFNGAIDATADEHAAALDVHRADGVRKDHDGENEPRRGLADVPFRFAAGVVSGRSKVVKDDCRGFPKRNEGQERGSRDYNARNCVAAPTLGGMAVWNRIHVWVIRLACEQAADINARKFARGSLAEGCRAARWRERNRVVQQPTNR